jgi:two-component system CheB/CheR fusion protein
LRSFSRRMHWSSVVDLVLPVEQMGERLRQYAEDLRKALHPRTRHEEDETRIRLDLCTLLLKQTGHDFSGYKEKTFMRRVHRRMQVLQLSDVNQYAEHLGAHPDEVTLLFRDLLIGVTNFFRDSSAFEALVSTVIPNLFENKGIADTVRVWVAGCATGEEVYSLAILLREHMDKLKALPKVQIFATDIDEAALAVARAGRYPGALLGNVSGERLKRFFVGDDVTYAVSKDIRDLCMFSPHNVVRDPPFSRIDLVSCRNLLIYFSSDFQAYAIPVFHFALRPRGYLFLGTSENVTQYPDLFHAVDKKHRVFQRRDHVVPPLQFPHLTPLHRAVRRGQRRSPVPGPVHRCRPSHEQG